MNGHRSALFLGAVTVLLCGVWALRAMTTFDDVGEAFVISAMRYQVEHHRLPPGGLLYVVPADTAYPSRSGVQGIVAGQIAREAVAHLDRLIAAPKVRYPDAWYLQAPPFGMVVIVMKTAALVATALVIALLATFVANTWGYAGAALFALIVVNSPWLANWASNLDGAAALLFAPFVAAWYATSAMRQRQLRFRTFCLLVGSLTAAKSLAGYEWLSAVVSAASVPLVYFGIRDRQPVRDIARRVILTGIAGTAGFLVAVGVHLIQLAALRGTYAAAFASLHARASTRALTAQMDRGLPVSLLWEVYPSQQLLGLSGMRLPLWLFLLLLLLVAFLFLRCANRAAGDEASAWRAGGVSLLYGLACSLSWPILALNHMVSQRHLGLIVFFIPAALLLFMAPAWALEARRLRVQQP